MRRAVAPVFVTAAWLAFFVGPTGRVLAAPAPGLTLAVAPTDVLLFGESSVTVVVTNAGGVTLRDVNLEADDLPATHLSLTPSTIKRLDPGESTFASLELSGAPTTAEAAVVRAEASAGKASVVAVATVKVGPAPAPATLALVGNSKLTDASPADLSAVLTNSSAHDVTMTLRGDAGRHSVRFASGSRPDDDDYRNGPLPVTVPSRAAVIVAVQVEDDGPLRRGKVAVVLTASVAGREGTPPAELTATKELDVELSTLDLLPGPLGVGSAVLIPGILGVWAWLAVHAWDRRRMGVDVTPPAKELFENKLWVLASAVAAIGVAMLVARWGEYDILDTPTWEGLAVVAVATSSVGAVAAYILVKAHRAKVPLIHPGSAPIDVLDAALLTSDDPARDVYRTPEGKKGLFVHHDRGLVVLAPPIYFLKPAAIVGHVKAGKLGEATEAARSAQFDGVYAAGVYVATPVALASPPRAGFRETLLEYRDPEQAEAEAVAIAAAAATAKAKAGDA